MSFNLHLYNTASKKVEPVNPVVPGRLSMYLCGATVQGPAHIGHVRAAVGFDVLRRWAQRCGLEVRYVRNITDIDDKILAKSAEAGVPWWAWAARWERDFDESYRLLGVLPPTFEPRATGHILDQQQMIQTLMDRGHAYSDGKGNVYFEVHSLPDYGSLTRQRLADMQTTEDESQIDAATEAGKRDHRDFALWKAAKPTEPPTASWDSPWGRGRPGWHLECSAMSRRYLGDEFDIHGGGIDLRFPHHENEIAQSHGAGYGFARIWMHNAWVTAKGEKMSKSLGNGLGVRDLVAQVGAPVLRLALGTVHYRSTIEFDDETLSKATALWERLSGFVGRVLEVSGGADSELNIPEGDLSARPLPQEFISAMDDDLNLARAMAAVHAALKSGNAALSAGDHPVALGQALDLRAMLSVLGLDPLSEQWASSPLSGAEDASSAKALDVLIGAVLEERAAARAAKDWARADELRDRLAAAGVVVEDGKDGARWHLS